MCVREAAQLDGPAVANLLLRSLPEDGVLLGSGGVAPRPLELGDHMAVPLRLSSGQVVRSDRSRLPFGTEDATIGAIPLGRGADDEVVDQVVVRERHRLAEAVEEAVVRVRRLRALDKIRGEGGQLGGAPLKLPGAGCQVREELVPRLCDAATGGPRRALPLDTGPDVGLQGGGLLIEGVPSREGGSHLCRDVLRPRHDGGRWVARHLRDLHAPLGRLEDRPSIPGDEGEGREDRVAALPRVGVTDAELGLADPLPPGGITAGGEDAAQRRSRLHILW